MLGHILILAMTVTGKRRVSEIGFIVGGIGAILVIVEGVLLSRSPEDRRTQAMVTVAAGLLIGIAFLFQIISQHF